MKFPGQRKEEKSQNTRSEIRDYRGKTVCRIYSEKPEGQKEPLRCNILTFYVAQAKLSFLALLCI